MFHLFEHMYDYCTNKTTLYLVELCLEAHFLVAGAAGEVVHAPRLVQRGEHVRLDRLQIDR